MNIGDWLQLLKLLFFYALVVAVLLIIGAIALVIMAIVSTGQTLGGV